MKRELKEKAREAMIAGCINAALGASEGDNPELAAAIREETLRLAKRLTPETYWHGLGEPKPEGM